MLGMAIYGTELALWTGVFVCGGFFNLAPWVKARVSSRRQQRIESGRHAQAQRDEPNSVALHDMPSSTSVFRTPSSALVERSSVATR